MPRYLLFILSVLSLLPYHSKGQIMLLPVTTIDVYREGGLLVNAWAGGLNSAQFSVIDINNDDRKDLVAFERNFYGSQKVFLNEGQTGEISFAYAPLYRDAFPHLRNWMLLRDYNCDGREDIFTSVPGGIAVYRNDLTPEAGMKFTLVTPLLQTLGLDGITSLYVAPPDIPAIVDVDNDGDLDILAFNIIGSTLEYHKNLSMENTGSCDQLVFELRNACWGYFSEDGNNNTVTLYDTCAENVSDPEKLRLHAGSTVLALDLTGNGVKDLLLGDITYNNLVRLTNGGTTTSAVMIEQSTTFPNNSVAVDITVFPAAYHIDVDNDDRRDMIVAPNNPNTSENFNNIWLYLNKGTDQIPEFEFVMSDFLQQGMIDLGEGSAPRFFDATGDGLYDIIAGNKGYFTGSGQYSSRLMLLQNTGTQDNPEFTVIDDDYAGLAVYDFPGIYPAFGDIDSDGDEDMLIGDEDGRLHLFSNTATGGEAPFFELTHPNYFEIDAGQSAKPQLTDVNDDELMDILVGERSGTILYFENTGTASNAIFNTIPTNETFGNIDVMAACCTGYSAPFLTTDSLGSKIIYVGSEQGYLYLFDDIEGNLTGTFNLVDSLYLHGVNVNVMGADINQDGKQEFVYGEFAGGLGLLKYGMPPVFRIPDTNIETIHFQVYPNPATSHLYLKIQKNLNNVEFRVHITSIWGNVHLVHEMTDLSNPIDISNLKAGMYFITLEREGIRITEKFLKK